jgi:hypothetical protein
VFRRQFKTVAEHNCWTRLKKSTYVITALQGHATDVLHGVPNKATYEETFEAPEDGFGEQQLSAAYRTQLKSRTKGEAESCKNLPQPPNRLPTMTTLHYPRTT